MAINPRYAVSWDRLSEFVGEFVPRRREFGSHFQLLRGARDDKALARTVNKQLTKLYNEEATAFSRSLGGGDFRLGAAWKQRELQRKSNVIAKSLKRTFSKERDRIARLPFSERKAAREKLVDFKDRQLDQLLRQEANFAAQTDIMAHSGSESQKLVDVSKSKVMYFQNLGDRTCDFCIGIASGNPYSIQQATTLGSGAHPNCVCAWTQEWTVDPDVLRNAKRQVEDGEVRIWDGSARTPVGGKALTKVKKMQVRKGGWRGRRIEQKKVIFQKTGQKVKQPYPAQRTFGPRPIRGIRAPAVLPEEVAVVAPEDFGIPTHSSATAFFPKKTSADIELWAQNKYPDIEWDIRRVHPDAASSIVHQFDELAVQYPQFAAEVKSVGTRPLMPMHLAEGGKNTIEFNEPWFGTVYAKGMENIVKAVDTGFSPPGCGSMEALVTHEFGHVIEKNILAGPMQGKLGANYGRLSRILSKMDAADVSAYATVGTDKAGAAKLSEFFAEAFAMGHHTPKAQQAKGIAQLMKWVAGL